jgi:superfamily II DNA or RNA helicase
LVQPELPLSALVQRLNATVGGKLQVYAENTATVFDVGVDASGVITCTVDDLGRRPAHVRLRLTERDHRGCTVNYACSCHAAKCDHPGIAVTKLAVRLRSDLGACLNNRALLARYLGPQPTQHLPAAPELTGWEALLRSCQTPAARDVDHDQPERVTRYVLEQDGLGRIRKMRIMSAKITASGRVSGRTRAETIWPSDNKPRHRHDHHRPYYGDDEDDDVPDFFDQVDRKLGRLLAIDGHSPEGTWMLDLIDASDVFTLLLASERLCLKSSNWSELEEGPPRSARLAWTTVAPGRFILSVSVEGGGGMTTTSPAWFADGETGKFGRIDPPVPEPVLRLVLADRILDAADAPALSAMLVKSGLADFVPPPPRIEVVDGGTITPDPILTLSKETAQWVPSKGYVDRGKCRIDFLYRGKRIYGKQAIDLDEFDGARHIKYRRDENFEYQKITELRRVMDEEGVPFQILRDGQELTFGTADSDSDRTLVAILGYQKRVVPRLRATGWQIEYADDFDAILVEQGPYEVNFQESGERGWYDVSVEVSDGSKKIDIVDAIRRCFNSEDIAALIGSEPTSADYWVPIDGKRFVSLSGMALAPILQLLVDLHVPSSGRPQVSRFDIAALEAVAGHGDIRLSGAERMFEFANAIREKTRQLPIEHLAGITATLRPYQVEGVAWMTALSDMQVGGVLGDDMGLGKTLQTLAHLWVQIQQGKTGGKPSLAIVTRTAMLNWCEEAARFVPGLTVVRYEGTKRNSLAEKGRTAHLVVTSYGLISRDEWFLNQEWHIVACDEGHRLSNPRTQAAKTIVSLKAHQKLVISATPIQNRPADLWSIMSITTPGLLRNHHWFNERFVKGIKGSDGCVTEAGLKKQRLLGQIVQPFRLHRDKYSVGLQIPAVTTIHRHLEMEAPQRTVYEAVRSLLDKDVREVIARKGLAKSHISVLAGIMRLRQVCCDPRLLKTDAHVGAPSVKMEAVLELLTELRAENKSVVVTSQWRELLDLIAGELDAKSMPYGMLVGGLSQKRLSEVVTGFRSGTSPILLMTLKVGESINLPEGDVIIVMEPWWNQQAIDQAVGRLTRDERDKKITAIYLIVKGSLEEGVLKIAAEKGAMIEAIEAGAAAVSAGGSGGFSLQEINDMLRPMPEQ